MIENEKSIKSISYSFALKYLQDETPFVCISLNEHLIDLLQIIRFDHKSRKKTTMTKE